MSNEKRALNISITIAAIDAGAAHAFVATLAKMAQAVRALCDTSVVIALSTEAPIPDAVVREAAAVEAPPASQVN